MGRKGRGKSAEGRAAQWQSTDGLLISLPALSRKKHLSSSSPPLFTFHPSTSFGSTNVFSFYLFFLSSCLSAASELRRPPRASTGVADTPVRETDRLAAPPGHSAVSDRKEAAFRPGRRIPTLATWSAQSMLRERCQNMGAKTRHRSDGRGRRLGDGDGPTCGTVVRGCWGHRTRDGYAPTPGTGCGRAKRDLWNALPVNRQDPQSGVLQRKRTHKPQLTGPARYAAAGAARLADPHSKMEAQHTEEDRRFCGMPMDHRCCPCVIPMGDGRGSGGDHGDGCWDLRARA